MPISNLVVFESPGPPVLSLVPWSLGPLVGPLVLRFLGPLVFWSLGFPSFGDSSALNHFEDNP